MKLMNQLIILRSKSGGKTDFDNIIATNEQIMLKFLFSAKVYESLLFLQKG